MQDRIEDKQYQKNINLKLWGNLVREAKSYYGLMIFLGLVMLFLAGADAITPLLTRYAIDNFIVPQEYQGLFWFGLFYIVLVLFQSFGVLLLIAVAGKIETGLNFNLRRKCYKRLQ
ncbi:MAG: ABC transporter ATP-binding protein, partial [Candidatus Cloacimonetes bacterium]|nr:ABC transporter ATP-binding protein [Candidatus Cloacimonadota bacterium]